MFACTLSYLQSQSAAVGLPALQCAALCSAVSAYTQSTLLAQPYAVDSDISARLKCSISSSDSVQHSPCAEFSCTCSCPTWLISLLCFMGLACLHHMTMLVFHGCGCSVNNGLCAGALGLTSSGCSITISSAVATLPLPLALLEYM
jgi:hypothetical protein